jgi:hypothetical protein
MTARRAWLLAWLGGPLIGIANGTARELGYEERLGEQRAHQLSTVTAIGLFAAYFDGLSRRWPLSSREALGVGGTWLALTVAFEFGFGRLEGKSWRGLLADYDLRHGRLWPLALLWIGLGPTAMNGATGRARWPCPRGRPSAGSTSG